MVTPLISIVIPAYNEEAGIRKSLDGIVEKNYHSIYEVIYIDDGSTDKTYEIITEYPVKCVRHPINKGYGAALKTGIRKATGTYVVILDSDGQHDPKYLDQLIGMLPDYDMVIGERTANSFQVKSRQKGKRLIRILGEMLVEQQLPDYNSGFRGFDRQLITELLHIMPNGFSFSTTSTLAFLKEGYTIGTFPIVVEERIGRSSNVKFLKDGSKTLLLIMRIIMLFNPLKIFFPASLLFFFLGIGWGIAGYLLAGRFPNSASLLTILGMFIFFIGLLADQISLLNRTKQRP
ncbi:MAG: glycosyltransferase family 2 protein [Bacteroidales bacterium]|jgi:glycosyltransferase involved in cell wall biosynthesis|nr:glycosyltransferase family 2 protein [Bacteroidales bacterium]MCK9448677.1 glycosyltransferase family 2 protein [Bacteroidales bacterium]MDD3702214.1 glycosyltransferase family 2 protein [Bacteroidales bacterium]MDY0368912.1 glycosyltransferase family 2 protein [Bacteroidales bacterium]